MIRLTRAQVREIDRRAIEEYHIPGTVLMENAARGAAGVAMEMSREHKSAMIVCGGGNNGGDGLAVARHLHNAGWSVDLILANGKPYEGDALVNFQIVRAMNLPIKSEEIFKTMAYGIVIDALFGTGLKAAPREAGQHLIDLISTSGRPVLAIDIPSGMDCDIGKPTGRSCVCATKTVTFVAEKIGFANPESKQYTGEIIVGDIGCPRELIAAVSGCNNLG
jgi:NAD(P)H-hydrate epimerase